MTDYLRTKVEARDGIKVDRDFLLRPFSLMMVSATREVWDAQPATYSAVLITLNLLLLSAAETALINKLRELLLHHLFDLGNGLLEAFL